MPEATQTSTATQTADTGAAENTALRTQLANYEAELRKTQGEKAALTAAAAADSARLSAQLARANVREAASRSGIVNVALADILPIDHVKVDVATGKVEGLEAQIAAWRQTAPEIFRTTTAAPAAEHPAAPGVTATQTTTTVTPAAGASGSTAQPFGPGLAAAPQTPPPAVDVRKMPRGNSPEYMKAKQDLLNLARKADGQRIQ